MLDAILFDFDGTLFSTDRLVMQAFRETLAAHGVAAVSDQRLRQTFGALMEDIMAGFLEEYDLPGCTAQSLTEEYRICHNRIFSAMLETYDGIPALLDFCRAKGLRLAVLTSRKRRSTMEGLAQFGFTAYFEIIQTADDCPFVKPDPGAAMTILNAMGVAPDRALILGDSRFDILCGRAAGTKTALALWERGMDEAEIAALKPDLTAHTVAEFQRQLAALLAAEGTCAANGDGQIPRDVVN